MPRPKPNPALPHSRHRKARGNLLVLPAEGCVLQPPRIPPGRDWTRQDRALWRSLWASPQANMWDDSYAPAVAMYVVHLQAVLAGTASAWQAAEARHLGDRLGLTPSGMASLGWRLPDPGEDADIIPLRSAQ